MIDPGTGASLAVTYSNASKTMVLLGSLGTPVEIMNVATGIADADAVNVKQMTDAVSGLRSELGNNLKYVRVNAIGTQANAGGTDSVAIGSSANTTAGGAVAIGTGARASVTNTVAIGQNSVANQSRTVSIGSPGNERKLVNVADGDISADSTDAVTGSQLYAAMTGFGAGLGVLDVTAPLYAIEGVAGDNTASLNGADINTFTAMAFGVKSLASGADATSFGLNCVAQSDNAVAIGSSATTGADTPYSVALGSDAATTGIQAIAMGAHVQANADNAVAVGNNNTWALGTSSIAMGDGAKERGASGIAMGKGATTGNNTISAIALGTSASVVANVSNGTALGASASVSAGANGGVALGHGSIANRGNAVSIGATTGSTPVGPRQIINLSAGMQPTDAVNVGQLQGVTTAIGGGAAVNPVDGSITQPSYTIGGTSYDNVSAAINAVAAMAGTDPHAVAYDDTAKDTVTLDGANGTLLTNVKPGSVAISSLDAINGGQLFGTADSLATHLGGGAATNPDGTVRAPTYVIGSTVANDVNQGFINLLDVVNQQLTDAGLVDASGQAIAAVTYDGALKSSVTLGGTSAPAPVAMSNVAPGALSANSTDTVNGAQLYATNQSVGDLDQVVSELKDALDQGGVLDPVTGDSLAVTYADATRTDIALGTAGIPVTVSNVGPGALSASSTDTVNGAQLYATNQAVSDLTDALESGGVIDPSTGESLAVIYDSASKSGVTLGGTGAPVTVSNVKDGLVAIGSTQAVNGAQLYATNQSVGDLDQVVSELKDALDQGGVLDPVTGDSLAVTYADASKTDIALGTAGIPVTVSNVGPGALSANSTDTVNGAQLYATNQAVSDLTDALESGGVIDPSTGESLAVTYADTSKTDITLGASGVPVMVSNVKDGLVAIGSTQAVNGAQLYATNQSVGDLDQVVSELKDALDQGGVLDPVTGDSLAVTYADATRTDIALGTAGIPVTVSNVGPGALSANSTDTVNGAQLYATNQAVSDLTDALESGGVIDPSTGESLAVIYDSASKSGVTLGGTGAPPVPLHNVATGTTNTDGVNVAQLTNGLSTLKDELTNGAIDLKYIKVSSTGTQANATGVNAAAIGSSASATGNGTVSIGTGARASALNAVALGLNSVANQPNAVSVGFAGGERKIINVDDGDVSDGSTDAVNGGQLFAVRRALDALAGTHGVKDVVDPLAAIEGRSGNNIASVNGGDPSEFTAAAIGVFSMASGRNAIAVGLRNVAGSDYSVALGRMAQTGADHEYAVAVGSDVHTNAPRAVAFGTRVQANAEHALAIGSNDTWAMGQSSIAIGDGAKVRGKDSIAMGRNAVVAANANDALALGAEASVTADAIGGVALGHGAVADRGNAISIGGGSVGTRQIIHVAAGTQPDDAVNVAQLHEAMAAMRAEIQLLRSQLGARPAGQ